MALKQISTQHGVKLQDTNTGKMVGSMKRATAPTPATVFSQQNRQDTEPEAPSISEMYDRYQAHLAAFKMTDKATEADEIAYAIARLEPTDLDDAQMNDVYRMLKASVGRMKDISDPTDEQWAAWCTQARNRLLSDELDISDSERARLLNLLDAAENGPKPDAKQFLMLNKFRGRMWAAKFALDEEYKETSTWFDAHPVNVKQQVMKFRAEYLERTAAGEVLEVPENFKKGFSWTAQMAPKDPATLWSHYKAFDPTLYDESAVPTRFVAFDTETTGREHADSAGNHVIQVGLVTYDHTGTELERFVTYIRPPERDGVLWTGPEDAVAVHGITPDMVKGAPTFAEVMPEIQKRFDGAVVVGQNVIAFDQRHMATEYVRATGDEAAGKQVWDRAADTLRYAKRFLTGLPNGKLSTLSEYYGIPPFQAHDAGDDAAATARVFFAMRREMKEKQRAAQEARRAADPWLT